jgi:hypothetical protein
MPKRYRYLPHGLMFAIITVAVAQAQYLGKTTSKCGSCTIPDNSCNSRPNPNAACSATNVGTEQAWPSGSKINVYIDTSPTQGFSSTDVTAIENAFTGWQTASGTVTFTFTPVNGLPQNPTGSYWTVSVGNANGWDANTTWKSNSNGNVTSASTTFQSASATAAQITDLMTHEIAHPMGLGDENESACDGVSVTYEGADTGNGNDLSTPSTCDKTAFKALSCAGGTAKCSANNGGSSGGGQAPDKCSGSQPNGTCECISGTWECDCSGSAPTCDDGTEAVCYDSDWTCGTVTTTQCVGEAPTCPECYVAVCASDNDWECEEE